jgi:D-psicose/D-tagatose/L-ribulose 3-epimerase
MKLSVSNIAWEKEEDYIVYELMRNNGFTGLDIAPSRILDNPLYASDLEIQHERKVIEQAGFSIIGMQSLLYGHPELKIFESEKNRQETVIYLKRIIDYASKLGTKVLVFGSPKNRQTRCIDLKTAQEVAAQFFSEIGNYSIKKNISFCIEPNPVEYESDFITTTEEAIGLVKKVNNIGFGLHVDLGTILINNEPISETLERAIPLMKHFHISHPYLQLINKDIEVHQDVANVLRKFHYDGFVSIEMKSGLKSSNILAVNQALEFVSKIYGN